MKIRTFIDRPILAGVISVLILILGFIGLSQLPIEQFPEIAHLQSAYLPLIQVPMLKLYKRV